MIGWENYRLILAVYRAKSLRRAGEVLGLNHATISRQLSGLNHQIGLPVFERVDGIYTATAVGQVLVEAALKIEKDAFEAERRLVGLQDDLHGQLTLSLPEAVAIHLLIDDLKLFATQHPEVNLTVETSNSFSNLDERKADVVVRVTNDPPDHLVGRRLFKYARCEYCHPDYLTETNAEEMRWLGWPGDANAPDWVKSTQYPDVPIGLRLEDPLVRHAAARAGAGLILDTCFIADQCNDVVRLPGARPKLDRDIWILTHPDTKNSAKVKALMHFLSNALIRMRSRIEGNEG